MANCQQFANKIYFYPNAETTGLFSLRHALAEWIKKLINLGVQGKIQVIFCFFVGLLAFPFALIFIISAFIYKQISYRLRR